MVTLEIPVKQVRVATPGYQGKREERDYLACEGMLDGRDEDIRCRTTKVVKTRKPHDCFSFVDGGLHPIPKGTMAICETAIVDGGWGTYYTCLECADEWLQAEYGQDEAEDSE
jgi:hypothetical protein